MRLQFRCPTCNRMHHKEVGNNPHLTLVEKTALCGCDPTRQPPPERAGGTPIAPRSSDRHTGDRRTRITELARLPPNPPPQRSAHPAVIEAVLGDFIERDHMGKVRYGQSLAPFDGRDRGVDLYEELLDAVCYERARRIEEQWYFIVEGDPAAFLIGEAQDAEAKGCTILVAWIDRAEVRRVGHMTTAAFEVAGTVLVTVVPQGMNEVLGPDQIYAIRRIPWPANGPTMDEVNRVEFTTDEEATIPTEPKRDLALT